jgi:gamma-glutamyltranspeptidase/glutathione hydrolase
VRAEPAFERELYRGGLARRLLASTARSAAPVAESSAPGGTTHISVVDAAGNAASLSSSIGSGSGVVVPGTGIHLNNMLGEADLNPGSAPAGRRLTSMMAPSIVLRGGRPRLVVGSAGSARLRGAILQVVLNVVEHGLPVGEAIERARLHVDGAAVHCEGGLDTTEVAGYELIRWRERNLFFGGVSGVELRDDGTLAAAGDPRRGGHGVVVA